MRWDKTEERGGEGNFQDSEGTTGKGSCKKEKSHVTDCSKEEWP